MLNVTNHRYKGDFISVHESCTPVLWPDHTTKISYHEGKAELDSQFTTIVSIDRLPRGQLVVEKMNITLMRKVCMNWHLPANKRKILSL